MTSAVRLVLLLLILLHTAFASAGDKAKSPYFGIQVLDEQTGRGVPLIELRTVNDIRLVTDSAGWAAFDEPGLMDREVHFTVSGPGYEFRKDGFGFRGIRLKTTPGTTAAIKIKRVNIAERLCRLTGQGIYRDSTLLGRDAPLPAANLNGGVLGQDSVQAVPYRGKLFWLWGDTNVANYPLGNFHTTAAVSPLPGEKGCDPETGVALSYFMKSDKADQLRPVMPAKEPGVVWLFGLLTLTDDAGEEALVAHYTRRKSLGEQLEHGLARFDDKQGIFVKIATLDLKEMWRYPRGNAVRVREADGDYFYFASPFCHTRVKAEWKALLDPKQYEALRLDVKRGAYAWQRDLPPTTQAEERKLVAESGLPKEKARFALTDTESDRPVSLHGASIVWSDFRRKWLLIGLQFGDKAALSLLGEVWYAEADRVEGPWHKAIQVASHPRYSFYNPRQHPYFSGKDSKHIYFEGTYTHTFSGNPVITPRYDYNQILYRLDLTDERLKSVR